MLPFRPRVLLIAEQCDPGGRAASLIGWSLCSALRAEVDAHIVTERESAPALERAGLIESRDFTAIDTTRLKRAASGVRSLIFGKNSERGWGIAQALSLPGYYQFERKLWRQFGPRLRAGEFDVVHRVVPITPDLPSILAPRLARIGVPFVVGPLNGGLPWPEGYDSTRRADGEWLSYVRGITKLVPGLEGTRRHASAILLASRDMLRQNPARHAAKAIYLPENGIDPARFHIDRNRHPGLPLRLVFLGRLVPYKGPDMVLEAAAPLLSMGLARLDIVGSGPLREVLEKRIAELGLEGSVSLVGNVPHTQVQSCLAEADLMCSPAVREFGGAVVMEAMYMGAVPVVLDYGGPPEYATQGCGFALPLGPREQIVAAMRALLTSVVADPAQLVAMSAAAQIRAREHFQWDVKARQLLEVYRWVLTPDAEKPDFGTPLGLQAQPQPGQQQQGQSQPGQSLQAKAKALRCAA